MLGVFLDRDTVDIGDIDLARLEATLPEWRHFPLTAPAELAERIAAATAIVCNKVRIDDAAMAAAPELKLICIAATGTNNVDLEAARRRGIAVCNVVRYATPAVVQHVFALLLALVTRLPDYQRAVAAGRWHDSPLFCLLDFPVREIAGMTLGIVGYGELGQGVARVAEAFGMEVLVARRPGAYDERGGRLPLAELLPRVDVLSLHTPLAAETRGLIGAAELAAMRPTALLLNTARGGLVDEAALAAALREGRLGGAGIDVLAVEPPRADSPLLAPGIPNLILTPHIAWASRESRRRLMDEVAENVLAWRRGEERNRV